MARVFKRIAFAAVGGVTLLVLVAILIILFVNLNQHKSRIEAIASDVSGMQVTIGGSIALRFLPTVSVRVDDITAWNRETELLVLESATVAVEIRSLFRGEVVPTSVVVRGLALNIERARDGSFNFEVPGWAERPHFEAPPVTARDARISFVDHSVGFRVTATDCDISLDHLVLPQDVAPVMVSLSAEFSCAEVGTSDLRLSEVRGTLSGEGARFTLNPVEAVLFDGQGSGTVVADLTGDTARFEVDYALRGFRIEPFLEMLNADSRASGRLDLVTRLRLAGDGVEAWRRSADGRVALTGRDLGVEGVDLDQQLERFESTQSFDLVDAGAFFFAGPLGVAVTKGHDFGQLLVAGGGSTVIARMSSEWTVSQGIAEAQDVALATRANRIAMKGKLDFVNERFEGLTVAVIDPAGCAKAQQVIRGSFNSPTVDAPSMLRSITAPVTRLLGRVTDMLPGRRQAACTPFYTGAVPAPATS